MSEEARELPQPQSQPKSLGPHRIPEERAALIRDHIAMLSETALAVSERLAFTADATDLVRVLESEPEDTDA